MSSIKLPHPLKERIFGVLVIATAPLVAVFRRSLVAYEGFYWVGTFALFQTGEALVIEAVHIFKASLVE